MSIDEKIDVGDREEEINVENQRDLSEMYQLKDSILENLRNPHKPQYLDTQGKSVTLYG
jgi:hypothetical protein